MRLPVEISLPYLWGNEVFRKDEWAPISYLIGANGTGKSLFAMQFKDKCPTLGLKPRYLNAERLVGLERQAYHSFGYTQMEKGLDIGQFSMYKTNAAGYGLSADAFILLKERMDIRIKIEATLSQLFNRRIRLAESGGFLNPMVQRIGESEEYGLRQGESHGLKELITLLTFIYSDEHNCLILDEPELHLHPQFQALLLQEMRHHAGDPRVDASKKCFVLITHSPYIIDVRTLDDLANCVIFHPNGVPTYLRDWSGEDAWRINRLLPRLNTHHKQFFFAYRPIFVEGYFDQQLFALIQEQRGKLLGASGSCVIDVGGKEELDLFFRLCAKLDIRGQFIADLDALFLGKLRQTVSADNRCRTFLQDEGLGTDLLKSIGELESALDGCLDELVINLDKSNLVPESLQPFWAVIHQALQENDNKKRNTIRRHALLLALRRVPHAVEEFAPKQLGKFAFIKGRAIKLLQAFRCCDVYILPDGQLENYLPTYAGNPYSVTDVEKAKAFEQERQFLLSEEVSDGIVSTRYGELIPILDEASKSISVSMDAQLGYIIGDWIYKVQSASARGEISDEASLQKASPIEWASHSRIFDLVHFSRYGDTFTCEIQLRAVVDPHERIVAFDQLTRPAGYRLAPPRHS